MRCDFLASQKRTAEALAEYERLLTVNPNYAIAYNVLGYASAARGDFAEAEDVLKKALALKGDFFPAYGHLGTVEIGRGNPAKAAEYYLKASDEATQP